MTTLYIKVRPQTTATGKPKAGQIFIAKTSKVKNSPELRREYVQDHTPLKWFEDMLRESPYHATDFVYLD